MRKLSPWSAAWPAVLFLLTGCGGHGRLETNADPTSLVLDDTSRTLYVACEGAQTVEAWDLGRRSKTAEASAGRGPLRLVLGQGQDKLYVLDSGSRSLLVLQRPALKAVGRLRLPDAPSALWDETDTRSLWVACAETNRLLPFAGLNPLPAIETGQEPRDLAREAGKDFLWVADRQSNDVAVVKLSEGQVVKRVAVWPNPLRLLLPADGNRLLVLCEGRDAVPAQSRVQVVDTLYQSAGLSWPAGKDARDFALGPDGRRLYVLTADRLLVQAADTGALLAELKVGRDPRALAIAPDESLACVSCREDQEVLLIKLTPSKWLP
ncbi:MAG: hypothetical protein AB1439_07730 [candidate division FCPU426 bacterium]